MTYEERLKNVTVLGAAGKMGSGILLLTAIEMADLWLNSEHKVSGVLFAVDVSDDALAGVMRYMRSQVLKEAEKKIVALRATYKDRKDLVDNEEIINQYVNDVLGQIRYTTRMEAAYLSSLVFEAIKEDPELKIKIFSDIDKNNPNKPWFFTNTSSIPITELDEKAGLEGRIIGFHFYNPPAIQKLVEVIRSKHTQPGVEEFALNYAKRLRKTVVPSNDIAGFIGNGHFMRDILYANSQVDKLMQQGFTFPEAVYAINRISQDFLIRPMGIFQLIDYVGIDVCSFIMSVMSNYSEETLKSQVLDEMLATGVKGGQFADGSQKDGFFRYERGKLVMIYDLHKKDYIPLDGIAKEVDPRLGEMPAPKPWKVLVNSPAKEEFLRGYFRDVEGLQSLGATLTREYAHKSKEIGLKLVKDNVALNEKDVNTVLLTGFYHAYGPVSDFVS